MNPIDDQINRLFRSAAQVRPDAVPPVPFGLETRALAAWREAGALPSGFWDTTVFVRGLVLASVIMAISCWPALTTTTTTTASTTTATANPFADFLQLTDSTVSSEDTQ
jgi:hypothetical protein